MQSTLDFARSFAFIIGKLKQQNSEFAKDMNVLWSKEIVSDAMLFYCINVISKFWRKYDDDTVDLSCLPNKNSSIQQAKIIMARLSCEEEESLSNTSHSEESTETLEEKSLTWYKKLEKAIHSQIQKSCAVQLVRVLA
ncbi:hypothetical protein AVEN_243352-1 [Araneus ventricosus]|uniref:Uncharacterized protein n=1 Tax=Araneus ventricosus TaxID=182803 RepID=A0A4Y2TYY8_ARAVE|nr:hypothetical protein AVEN_243352-1 [Araneus ventricosus]